MNVAVLEKRLAEAEEHVKKILTPGSGASLQDQLTAFEEVAQAQRGLAAAMGEEYAVPLDIGFVPEAAVSGPLLLQTEWATFLTFNAMRKLPDGIYHDAGHAIVEFEMCDQTRFGYPNDEALPGHPLYSRGLGGYGIYEVMNSRWVRQIVEQNRVSFPETPDSTQRHFIFTFHDSTFECVAQSLRADLSDKPYAEVFADIAKRVLDQG